RTDITTNTEYDHDLAVAMGTAKTHKSVKIKKQKAPVQQENIFERYIKKLEKAGYKVTAPKINDEKSDINKKTLAEQIPPKINSHKGESSLFCKNYNQTKKSKVYDRKDLYK
ncbi:hypothetical protein MHBO_004644, partial [Bonamia ostreae]